MKRCVFAIFQQISEKNGRICAFCWTFTSKKCFSFRGASPPWPPDQWLCPWTPLGAPPPDPRYRLALCALSIVPLCQILNTPLYIIVAFVLFLFLFCENWRTTIHFTQVPNVGTIGEWRRFSLGFHYYVFVCILPKKAVPEMTYAVLGVTLNPTHLLTHSGGFWDLSLPYFGSHHITRIAVHSFPIALVFVAS